LSLYTLPAPFSRGTQSAQSKIPVVFNRGQKIGLIYGRSQKNHAPGRKIGSISGRSQKNLISGQKIGSISGRSQKNHTPGRKIGSISGRSQKITPPARKTGLFLAIIGTKHAERALCRSSRSCL